MVGEPRVLDTDLAKALGITEPQMIRHIIKEHHAALEQFGVVSAAKTKSSDPFGRGRPGTMYYLNEEQALHDIDDAFIAKGDNLAVRAGVEWRCHDLRHRFASEFLQRTGDFPALQAILEHRTVTMTMRYAHMITAHLHEAMAKFGTGKAVSKDRKESETRVSI